MLNQDFQGSSRPIKLDAVLTSVAQLIILLSDLKFRSVPSTFNMRQRQALFDAADIANVNALGFVRETSAAALHHARDLPANFTGSKLFINMGAWRTQVCLYSRLIFFEYVHLNYRLYILLSLGLCS